MGLIEKLNNLDRKVGSAVGSVVGSLVNGFRMAAGRYDSGATGGALFQEYINSVTDADSSVGRDRKLIVERSRDQIRNTPVATGVIKRTCDHAIGDRGLALHSQIDREFLNKTPEEATEIQKQIESEWKYFSESKESDFERELNIPEKTYLTLQSELEGGDCFTLLTNLKRPGSEYNLKLQSVEGEYVSNKNNVQNSEAMVDGIEKNANGVPTKIWFSKFHPGDRLNRSLNQWASRNIFDSTGRRNILHHFDKIRFGQTRGIPVLGPVTNKLLQMNRLSNAELMAAVINSYYTIVVRGKVADTQMLKTNPTEQNTSLSSADNLTMGSGTIIRAKPGVELDSFDPNRPNLDVRKHFESMVAEIGAAIGVPKSLILMTFDKSYSASRGEVLLAWVYFLAKRTHVAVNFCQPVYEAFFDEAVSKNRIIAPGYFIDQRIRRAYLGSPYKQWTGPTRPAIDELKEAKALGLFNNMGAQSLQEIITKTTGKDVIAVTEQIAREHELRVKAGLETGTTEGITDKDIEEEEREDNENT